MDITKETPVAGKLPGVQNEIELQSEYRQLSDNKQVYNQENKGLSGVARSYIACNLSVIPVNDHKQPVLKSWKRYQESIMKDEDIDTYFHQSGVKGIAIVCGSVSSNLEIIDVDCKNDESGTVWEEYSSLIKESISGLYEKLVIAKTINKGYHLYYRCDQIDGNKGLARNSKQKILIETRGQGGYVIAPNSNGYQFIQGDYSKIPQITVEERYLLIGIAKCLDESILPDPKETKQQGLRIEGSVFDDFNQRGNVIELLEKHGWRKVKSDEVRIHFTRPGKRDKSISGNFHIYKRTFYSFSTSTIFEAGRGYNPVQVFATLECHGDYSVTSKALSKLGYGTEAYESSRSKESGINNTDEVPNPPFPITGFPRFIQDFIKNCTDTYSTNLDYWAGSVLISSALAIGNKLELVTKYKNIPVLWMVLVGDVSSGKSNPVDTCLGYFKKKDALSIKQYEKLNNEFERIKSMTPKERKEEGVFEKPQKPECFQYILNDYTPEAMVAVHKVNNRGILIERDELKGWIDDFNRYNKSGEQSNMLSSWSGIGITYNRKTTGPINIPHPCIFVVGGIQPDLLSSLAADKRAENGFLSRFCAIFPDNTSKSNYNDANIPGEMLDKWEEYLDNLTNIPEMAQLKLSSEATEKYKLWYDQNVAKTNEELLGYLKGVYGKLDIISLRLSIIIHGMNLAFSGNYLDTITAEEMEAAISITEYFRATALKVYNRVFASDVKNLDARAVCKFLYKIGRLKSDIAKVLKTSRSQVNRYLGS